MPASNFSEVIERAIQPKSLDREVMSSISNFLFGELKSEMNLYNNISINLEGLGIWFYRKNKLEEKKRQIEGFLTDVENNRTNRKYISLHKFSDEEVKEFLGRINKVLEIYPLYIAEKKATKEKRKKSKNESLF